MQEDHDREERQLKKLRLFISKANPLWDRILTLHRSEKRPLLLPHLSAEHDELQRHGAGRAASRTRRKVERLASDPTPALLQFTRPSCDKWRRQIYVGGKRDPRGRLVAIPAMVKRIDALRSGLQDYVGEIRDATARAAGLGIVDGIRVFLQRLDDSSQPVYTAGNALGMTVTETQIALDAIYFAAKPLLSLAYYDDTPVGRRVTRAVMSRIGGVWTAYLQRDGSWIRSALRVRYSLPVRGGQIVRTKLNVPMISTMEPRSSRGDQAKGAVRFIEYDGFVVAQSSCLYFSFERRGSERRDFMYVITDHPEDGVGPRQGYYLTSAQDGAMTPVTGAVVIERELDVQASEENEGRRRLQMRSNLRVLGRAEKKSRELDRLVSKQGNSTLRTIARR
jgi:hypothetical protein